MRWSLCLLLTLVVPGALLAQEKENPDEPKVPQGKVRLALDTGGHTSTINKVFFTPDSQQLITLSNDLSIRIWDVHSGESVNVLYPPRRSFAIPRGCLPTANAWRSRAISKRTASGPSPSC